MKHNRSVRGRAPSSRRRIHCPIHRHIALAAGLVAAPLVFAVNAHAQAPARPSGETAAQTSPAQTGGDVTLAPTRVSAERAQENGAGPVDGIVAKRTTTGTKTDTPLIETPQSVSVIPKEMIQDLGAQTVSQAMRYSAGVLPDNAGFETRFDWINIRGFSASTLGLYMDGTRLQSNTEFQLEPYGLERIEILRGPASVLYGQNTPGGLVNMVTKKPLDTPLHEIQLTGGSFKNKQAAFDFSGPLDADGKVLYRLVGLFRDSGTQVDHTPNDRIYIAPSLTWKATDKTTITFEASYQRDKLGFGQFLPASGTVRPNPNGQIPVGRFVGDPNYDNIKREQVFAGYQIEHRFNDQVTFKQSARYSYFDYKVDTDGYGLGYAAGSTSMLNRLPFADYRQTDVVTIDNQLQTKFDTGPFSHVALFGFDYYYYNEHRSMRQGVANAANQISIFSPNYGAAVFGLTRQAADSDSRYTQGGLYFQDQIKYGKHWLLTFGVRQDWAAQNVYNRLTNRSSNQSDSQATYRAGLTYLFDMGLAPYFSYSESFQPNVGTDRFGNQFKPSKGKQFEIGVKYQPVGYNSFVTLSLFDIRMSNVLTPDPANTAYSVTTGEQHSKGFEIEAVGEVTDNLKVIGSYTNTNITNSKANDPTLLGKVPPQQPRTAAALWADYTFHAGMLKGFGFNGGIRYVGPTYIEATNTVGQAPSRTLVDLGLHYQYDKHWRFQLDGSNIFDKTYVVCVTASQCAYGARRTILGTAKYTW
ncbi:TonB-dependent siderophore receptor [Pandoraea pulmonicola]|uniref:Ferric hydroxamate uptake n=1 Tax=Pandoraea pulmonicola TaxID=93221 RepID=A0AAJ5D2P6_PANPU|nr:TonB-dependent siderophore receptor [Pandoraea pulmonicola]SUA92959.1 Ferric hydroxamate uptake [Pandoraea pulmonicola]